MTADLAVLIPARNEAVTVGQVVAAVFTHCSGARPIVIDDASGDGTDEVARAHGATVLRLTVPLGAWGAIQTGMRYALQRNFRLAVTMDADGQHLAEEIPKLLLALGQADVVIGACPARGSRLRRVTWRFLRFLSGFSLSDLTSGFRAYNHRALCFLASPRVTLLDYQDLGVLLRLRAQGMKIREVGVVMGSRQMGKSRVFGSWLQVGVYLLQTALLCLARSENRS